MFTVTEIQYEICKVFSSVTVTRHLAAGLSNLTKEDLICRASPLFPQYEEQECTVTNVCTCASIHAVICVKCAVLRPCNTW
jgi:hypothetical protein